MLSKPGLGQNQNVHFIASSESGNLTLFRGSLTEIVLNKTARGVVAGAATRRQMDGDEIYDKTRTKLKLINLINTTSNIAYTSVIIHNYE